MKKIGANFGGGVVNEFSIKVSNTNIFAVFCTGNMFLEQKTSFETKKTGSEIVLKDL